MCLSIGKIVVHSLRQEEKYFIKISMKALCWTAGPKVLRASVCREKAWGPFLEVANHQVVLCIGTGISILPVRE